MKAWNLEELRDHIRKSFDDDEVCIGSLSSVDRNIILLMFHYFEARDALKDFEKEDQVTPKKHMEYVLGIAENQKDFDWAKISHEANFTACIHSARNLYDIFAQLINVLFLDKEIPENKCDIYKAVKKLPNSDLKKSLEALLESYWFKYVSAFSNVSKHRMLVTQSYSLDVVENKSGVKIGSFSYRDIDYPPYWSMEVLKGVLEVKNAIVDCGAYLNELVIGKCA